MQNRQVNMFSSFFMKILQLFLLNESLYYLSQLNESNKNNKM